jgi:hypothetical protein
MFPHSRIERAQRPSLARHGRFFCVGRSEKAYAAGPPTTRASVYFNRAARRCVDPPTIVTSTAWKFERVEAFVIEHCQEHVVVFWYCFKDEMPHRKLFVRHRQVAALI